MVAVAVQETRAAYVRPAPSNAAGAGPPELGMVAVAVQETKAYVRPAPRAEPRRPDALKDGAAPPPHAVPPLTEAMLTRLWAGQRFPASALVTGGGAPLRVLHPGRPGRGAGPDFRDALIAPASGPALRGDVELHVRAGDFRAHGHHRDRRYDRVVLHVVFEDGGETETLLACGRRVPVIALAPWVHRRARELEAWLRQPRLWREPCHDAGGRVGRNRIVEVLEELGDRRFAERQAALSVAVDARGREEALYLALLEGLGYGGTRDFMERVGRALPWAELAERLVAAPEEEREDVAEALLLGAAALLPSQRGADARHTYETKLEGVWREFGRGLSPAGGPEVAASRPANHPARRLAGLARLIVRHGLYRPGAVPELRDRGGPASRVVAAWTVPARGYWRERIAPGGGARSPSALIGPSRAIELLVNAVLPWSAVMAAARGSKEEVERALACFAGLPRPARYGALAFLETNFKTPEGALLLDARRQQGLLALYKTECTQGGCGRCALS